MKREQFERKWHEIKLKIQDKWEKLTDADIAQINGKYDHLSSKLQKKYGLEKEQAEQEIDGWEGPAGGQTYFWREDQ